MRGAILRAMATGLVLLGTAIALPTSAGVLPDDRADLMYHKYDGGGVTVDGPSLLVRKKFQEKYAVSASYYIDMVSSASIDVVTSASPYEEERTQYGAGFEYLRGKVTYALGFTNSSESDYEANTVNASVTQDFFGDLTTVSLGYSRGWDDVRERGNETFADQLDRRIYSINVSQVLTRNLIAGFSYETVSEEGFLNNPYRRVRYLAPGEALGYAYEDERYPRTRTGNAVAFRAKYFLPYRAAAAAEYRYYRDTWGIPANTLELTYTQPWRERWLFEGRYRYYTQDRADFYADLYPRENFQNFLARDKELATYAAHTIGFTVSYEFRPKGWKLMQKGTVNLRYDRMQVDYDDFRDLRVTGVAPGAEPSYSLDANVLQLYVSGWF